MKVFPIVIQYFDWKNGGLQSKLIEVHQQSNEVAETIVQYIKGTLENHVFLICRIFGFLTICYFLKFFHSLMVLKMQKISIFLKKYVWFKNKKQLLTFQIVSENFSGEILSNLKLYEKNT